MPFKSQSQRKKLYATNSKLAEEFEAATPKSQILPKKVKAVKRVPPNKPLKPLKVKKLKKVPSNKQSTSRREK